MLEHVYAARPNFDETRNGERASEKKKEKEPQPSVYVCIFVLVTGTRRDNPLLSAMPRLGSRQRCCGWTSWTCCGVFMSPKQVSFFLFRTVLVSKNCRSNKGFSGRWSRIWNPFYHMRHQYQDQDAPRICQLLRIPIFFLFHYINSMISDPKNP